MLEVGIFQSRSRCGGQSTCHVNPTVSATLRRSRATIRDSGSATDVEHVTIDRGAAYPPELLRTCESRSPTSAPDFGIVPTPLEAKT